MLIGYARISKADGSPEPRPAEGCLCARPASATTRSTRTKRPGQREDRPGLTAFLKAARQGDVIVVWRLDRLGRNLRHLVNLVQGPQRQGHRDPGARRPRGQHRHDDGQRKVGLRALRGFGGIRTRADPGTDPRWIGLCTSQGQEGRAPSRAEQSAGAASSGSDGASATRRSASYAWS